MKKLLFLLTFAVVAIVVRAQSEAKYLAGAVPEVDGRVIFSRTISVAKLIADDKLFDLMETWAKENYASKAGSKQRVLLVDKSGSSIACQGDADLVFKSTALSLDKAGMLYQLIIQVQGGKCEASVRSIKYEYNDTGSKVNTYPAEEMIVDKYALNSKGDKLSSYYSKFRVHTVDSVNAIFDRIDVYLNGVKVRAGAVEREYNTLAPVAQQAPVQAEPVVSQSGAALPIAGSALSEPKAVTSIATPVVEALDEVPSTMVGFRQVLPDKIPGNIIKLLNNWTLITSGTPDDTNVMTASWGGLGVFWEKPVAFCFLNPTRYSVSTMDKGDTYTISFYTEAYKDAMLYCGQNSGRNTDKIKGSGLTPIKTPSGATAFAEAWMIFECKKIVAQQISPDAVKTTEIKSDWSKNGFHKMYIGEILNVWIK
ncbi:DUF4468 domain-containing protein [Dysgonomonas macrotermitis]|uniref:NADH-FMN oxidoreductase RutF, flavin reductase (DIM6/NTAB) family n=1 Tax=Dysgonomonas macrotermitis TaxID=1346286 RepID=A0A1M5GPQ7_9BACT|nr:DUF4468 domain-containing protein [Dysgonomonas macrotermitis]SHG05790.1 NADH-FMN oxidoreductase RutF, flavin reductase (DIM6/NTAB) family [Dysgonomonas macrotermitis]